MAPKAAATVNLQGVYTALITPMKAGTGEVDYEALEALLDAQIKAGVAGVVPVGTTGESPALSVRARCCRRGLADALAAERREDADL
jgi:dihydrodipicolinate synthase/N-acetylneuraminate lyase